MAVRKSKTTETDPRQVARGFTMADAELPGRRRNARSQALRGEGATLPSVGQKVFSTSGRQMGVVAQVRPDSFHLATGDDDLWVTRDSIFTVEDIVTLICEPERISAYIINPLPRRNGNFR